ncbi:MAG: oxygenase MpaB family protein [Rhodococcus sp. (in: high G+C Gram-positive bacteria)]|uniref:oxygenase MpaB family protein n=1 Tax=Rhodococcus sp. TaxID=1831 RepID=UPI003BB7879A
MTTAQDRTAQVRDQKAAIPAIYGSIDFETVPLRFTTDPEVPSQLRTELADQRPRLLANKELVSLIADYTMLGDRVGDAYAALMPEYGFKRLVDMLVEACQRGVENVEDAPQELVDFIADMTQIPEWIDMNLVKQGAALERNSAAHVLHYAIRGGLIGTFMNKYTALPMAITGAFSERTAGKRVKETAAFFTSSVLPGALEPGGTGFHAAAMVRLMHSMVRINIMKRGRWNSSEYGIPIPQADQMPAGNIGLFQLSLGVLAGGRDHFNPDERARVEFGNYRCHLLGLPRDLLPVTPREIVDVMATRYGTLRKDWDDETCGQLLVSTLNASFEPKDTLGARIRARFEPSFSKVFFARIQLNGDTDRAAAMGVDITPADKLRALAVGVYIKARMLPFDIAHRIPAVRDIADRRLTHKVSKVLERYAGAEFRTDDSNYTPTTDAH